MSPDLAFKVGLPCIDQLRATLIDAQKEPATTSCGDPPVCHTPPAARGPTFSRPPTKVPPLSVELRRDTRAQASLNTP